MAGEELLIEIGCEEIPASWLPGLRAQFARHVEVRLREARLAFESPVTTFSTPRRLVARIGAVATHQDALEEVVTGPAVTVAFADDGSPTRAALGFAKKHGISVEALERHESAKGVYLAHRRREAGLPASDVLGGVVGQVLRDFSFPKQMRWDAFLDDGKGELVFARPIRWLVVLFGGQVIPFVIHRTDVAKGPAVRDIHAGAMTWGHRFLGPPATAGQPIEVQDFKTYQEGLADHFVILDRAAREQRITEGLAREARRLGGQICTDIAAASILLEEVPDLVECPSVVGGRFPDEFLALPDEVLTTTMIHHQHNFPLVDESGALTSGFLAVTNTEVDDPDRVATNAERVLTARLRDARFFWDQDRGVTLETRLLGLDAILFHKRLGHYGAKATRIAELSAWLATDVLQRPDSAEAARAAARLCKADLATDMVRELTELQGTMGGIYAREEGYPDEVWRAIYYHYLPLGVEADAPPTREALGPATVTWAAVSMADKLDSVVGMFVAGERPTGSRDPLGLRRQAQGLIRILVDLPSLTSIDRRLRVTDLLEAAARPFGGVGDAEEALSAFFGDRLTYLLEQRGFDIRNIRAVMHGGVRRVAPLEANRKLQVLQRASGNEALLVVAGLLKRVKNISGGVDRPASLLDVSSQLIEPAERALFDALEQRAGKVEAALDHGDYDAAVSQIAELGPIVKTFFDDILVNTDDASLRTARLALVAELRELILRLGDLSEMVTDAP